jgi:Mg/Co/Ni transporter MgtE
MKFFKILEKAWLAAILIAFAMGIYNFAMLKAFTYQVYTPFVCGMFCILIFFNIRRQRLFVENMKKGEEKQKTPIA